MGQVIALAEDQKEAYIEREVNKIETALLEMKNKQAVKTDEQSSVSSLSQGSAAAPEPTGQIGSISEQPSKVSSAQIQRSHSVASLDSVEGVKDGLAAAIKYFNEDDPDSIEILQEELNAAIEQEKESPNSTSLTRGVKTKDGKGATALDLMVRTESRLAVNMMRKTTREAKMTPGSDHNITLAKANLMTFSTNEKR